MFVPLRMCVGCRKMLPKNKLIRIVKDKQSGEIMVDKKHKAQCRGVYICPCSECIKLAKKKKSLERNFKSAVSSEIYDEIEKGVLNG